MKLHNILLGLGKGYVISLSQGDILYGSHKYHYVDVALMKDANFINTCYWYHEDVPYSPDMEDYYDVTMTHVTGLELHNILAKANLYVEGH
tara:strand:+ start:102 stop:374 length:273 start_codon:yes stop_codon:yes gene_type:complete